MAANKRKILEAARKHAQKGAKDRALKEYEKLLKLDPRDAKLRLEIGDAYRRWGQLEEAIGTYTKVAQQYMAEGFDARAVAVFKQIHTLDPERWATYDTLSELYQRMGLTAEAINTLQIAADGLHRAGHRREALDLLRKMAALDPSSTTSRLKVADLLHQEGLGEEAIAEYESTAEELERQGEADQAVAALQRVLEIDDRRVPALDRLARSLVQRELPDRAEPYAKRLVEVDPEEPDHYELLASVHRLQKREDALAAVYRRLAELYRRRGDEERAREITQRFVPVEGLSGSNELGGGGLDDDIQGDVSSFLEDVEDDDLAPETLLDEELLDPEPPVAAAPRRPLAEATVFQGGPELDRDPASTQSGPDPDADPDQLLAEACVYLRYGKRQQAVENLQAILVREPRHRGALEKLGEALADGGDTVGAVDVWLRAAGFAQEDGDGAALDVLRDRIAALDQAAAATLGEAPAPDLEEDFLEVSQPVAEVARDARPARQPDTEAMLEDIDIEVETDLDASSDDLEVELDEAPEDAPVAGAAGASAGGASSSASQQVLEDLEEAEFYLQQGLLDEAEAIYRRLSEIAPNHPQLLVRLGELEALRGEEPRGAKGAAPEPEIEVEVDEPSPDDIPDELNEWTDEFTEEHEIPAHEAPEPIEAAASEADDGDIEIEVGVDDSPPEPGDTPVQGMEPAVAVAGGETASELSKPTIDEVEPGESGVLPPVSDDAARELEMPAASGDFDLAAELNEALDVDPNAASSSVSGSQSDSFSAVFRAFKAGVSKTLSESDHEAHYDLGIAYREMGLFEDAMGEFRTAMGSPTRRLVCMQLLGQCAIELGRSDQAVGYLEETLSSGELSEEQQLPVRFDLGRAFEGIGDIERARSAWEAVAAVDPSFCDVEERLASLEAAPKPKKAKPASQGAADDFVSFDDLVEEANREESGAVEEGVDFDDVVAAVDDDEPLDDDGPELEAEEPEPEPKRPQRRRRKKISFV